MRHDDRVEAFIVIAVIVVIGVGIYASGATKRKLRKAKAYAIAELPESVAGRVIGQAQVLGETLTGPLTGRTCVYYIAKVEQRRSNGRSTYWRAIITEQRGVPFMLVDATGRAIIDPGSAELALDFDNRSTSGTFDDATSIEEAFLARHGQKSQGWVFNKGLRYREAVIEIGETIAVLGSGVREPDPDAVQAAAGYREGPPTRLRLTSSPKFPLIISDDPSTTR
jgi:hypothetical protein